MVALWIWNGKLLIATSTGVLVMLAVYSLQGRKWQRLRAQLSHILSGSNRQITLAVSSGGFATLSTYIAISLWMESENHWIATAAILQGLGVMATFSLLVWHVFSHQSSRDEKTFDNLVADLSDTDSLKRLIAVRQLTRLVRAGRADSSQQRAALDYFRLMLSREAEPLIRDALLDGLQALDTSKQLGVGTEPVSIPLSKKSAATKARQHIS
ncbi:MAG TPA: hypothetical protein IGR89_11905 [Oscillatoriaceae cyanobacterium M7585_C2015_266]|nr:hypothetical protein [Oscillatoriaceae cyanobacterium M7585_C2015_266]